MRMVAYLTGRGIDRELVEPRYAAIRGIGTDFIGDASGSDKNYSFSIPAKGKSQEVHLFESAIDRYLMPRY